MPLRKNWNTKSSLVVLTLAIGAGAAWFGFGANRSNVVDEQALRDTAGIELSIVQSRQHARAVEVQCRVTNQTDRPAASVVLTAQVASADGRVVGSNPLVNVLHLQPRESRDIGAMVPLHSSGKPPIYPQGKVNLVRWSE